MADKDLEQIAEARKLNQKAYQENKDWLLEEHFGEYAIIIGGKIFLGDTLEEVNSKAVEKYPNPAHRYFYKIGEESTKGGMLRWPMRRSE